MAAIGRLHQSDGTDNIGYGDAVNRFLRYFYRTPTDTRPHTIVAGGSTMFRVAICAAALLVAGSAAAQVHVRGYTRSDGTYVAPYTRSSPDSSRSNNYGSTYRAPAAPTYTAPRPLYTPPAPATTTTAPACSGYACYGQPSTADGQPRTTQVDGYFRSDGTYVQPYYRSSPSR